MLVNGVPTSLVPAWAIAKPIQSTESTPPLAPAPPITTQLTLAQKLIFIHMTDMSISI